jgi:hypothetical protein
MLIHIVCWKYKPETTPEQIAEHRAKLAALPAVIPEIVGFDIGEDVLHLDRSFDTGLVATFADRAGLDAYTVHADHQVAAGYGKEVAEKVVSVDFLK